MHWLELQLLDLLHLVQATGDIINLMLIVQFVRGRNDWILTPSFDLVKAYQAEFDFEVFGWNSATPATCGSDDAFSFYLYRCRSNMVIFVTEPSFTTAGGTRQIIDLSS